MMEVNRDEELRALYEYLQARGIGDIDQVELAAEFIGVAIGVGIRQGELSQRKAAQFLKRLHKFMRSRAGIRP